MKKTVFRIVFAIFLVVGLSILINQKNKKTEPELLREKYSEILKNHSFNKLKNLSKKERLSRGLPPNAYFEQEYLNEINPNTGKTHPENVFKLQKKLNLERILRKSPGDETNNPWIERGPNNVGGRTRAILFDPNDATHKRVFAGGVSGGLWVNDDITNENSSWQQVGVSENLAVSSITVDPNNSQVMYLGTGESQANPALIGNGVWKSIDGGNTWVNIFSDSFNSELRNRVYYINDIKAWNNNGNTEIFIGIASAYDGYSDFPGANSHGLYKSIDGGTTWNRVILPPIPNTNSALVASYYEPNDIEISEDNAIWIATENNIYGRGGGTILKSTNGSGFSVAYTLPSGNTRRTEIAISSQNPNKIYVLAEERTTNNTSGEVIAPYLSLLKTEDAFTTVSNINLPNDADPGISAEDFTRGQAFYDLVIETDPTNDEILYVGGIDLFRSIDSGNTWKQMSKWHPGNSNQPYFLDSNLPVPTVHADQHALVFHPTDANKAIIGNDGGVYYASSLSGAALSNNTPNTNISPRNKDYNTLQFYNGAIGQNSLSDDLLAGAQDNGTQFILGAINSAANSSQEVYGGDGAYSFIDKDGEYIIASYVYNDKVRFNLPINGNGLRLDDDLETGSFINAQDLDDNLDILYANGHSSRLGFDSIVRYKGIKPSEVLIKDRIGNPMLDDIATVLKVSPFEVSSTTLFLGLQNGKLLKVTNAESGAPSWESIGAASFVGSLSSISFGNNEDEILVTFHNYGTINIWFTLDGGSSWENKEGNLPDIPVKAIMMNPLNNDEVIIGTELGVWATSNFKDNSPEWLPSYNGMSNLKVTSLDLRSSDNTILATTYGRGMFTGKFTGGTASVEDVLTDSKSFTIYPTVSKGNFTLFAKNNLGKTKMSIYNLGGKEVYNKNLDFNENERQQVSVNLSAGIYIVNLVDKNNNKSSNKIIIK